MSMRITRNELKVMAIWASTSAGVALAVGAPALLHADGPTEPIVRAEAKPRLEVDGVELTVGKVDTSMSDRKTVPLERLFNLDTAPRLELVALNTTDTTKTIDVTTTLSTAVPASPLSRTMPMPKEAWHQSDTITLAPRETKTVSLTLDRAPAPGSSNTIGLKVGDRSMQALAFSMKRPALRASDFSSRSGPATQPAATVAQSR